MNASPLSSGARTFLSAFRSWRLPKRAETCTFPHGSDAPHWQAAAPTAAPAATPLAAEPEPAIEPAPAPEIAPSAGDAAGDWLCAWCHNRVANEKDRFPYDGKDEFTFTNPEGIRFALITFSRTRGCREVGSPTLEHTWFPGHAWSVCQCDHCGQQLGWYYAGQHCFAGLIQGRIVRALHVHN